MRQCDKTLESTTKRATVRQNFNVAISHILSHCRYLANDSATKLATVRQNGRHNFNIAFSPVLWHSRSFVRFVALSLSLVRFVAFSLSPSFCRTVAIYHTTDRQNERESDSVTKRERAIVRQNGRESDIECDKTHERGRVQQKVAR